MLGSPFRAVDLAALAGCDVVTVDRRHWSGRRHDASSSAPRAPARGRSCTICSATPRSTAPARPRWPTLHRAAAGAARRAGRRAGDRRRRTCSRPATVGEDAARWSMRAGDRALGAMAWEEAAGTLRAGAVRRRAPTTSTTPQATPSPASGGRGSSPATRPAPGGRSRPLAELGPVQWLGRAPRARRARVQRRPRRLRGPALRPAPDRSPRGGRPRPRRHADARLARRRAGPAVGGAVADRALDAPPRARRGSRGAAPARAGTARARPVPRRPLRRHRRPDARGRARCRGLRDHRHRRVRTRDGPLELLGRRLRFVARLEHGDVDGVEAEVGAFARRAEAVGNPLYSWYVPLWRGQAALTVGDVDTAERLVDEAEMLGRAAGSTNGPMLASVLRLVALWQRGEYAGAVERLADAGGHRPRAPRRTSPRSAASPSPTCGPGTWSRRGRCSTAPAPAGFGGDRRGRRVDGATWSTSCAPPLPSTTRSCRRRWQLIEPFADLVAFEGIGAGLYGAMARFVAEGCRAVGRVDDAVALRRTGARREPGARWRARRRRLAHAGRRAPRRPATAREAAALHDEADAAYRNAGVRPPRSWRRHAPRPAMDEGRRDNEWCRDGDVWRVAYGGTTTIVKHSKGMADLAVLLSRPGREVHVTELGRRPGGGARRAAGRRGARPVGGRGVPERLGDLAADIDEADAAPRHRVGPSESPRRVRRPGRRADACDGDRWPPPDGRPRARRAAAQGGLGTHPRRDPSRRRGAPGARPPPRQLRAHRRLLLLPARDDRRSGVARPRLAPNGHDQRSPAAHLDATTATLDRPGPRRHRRPGAAHRPWRWTDRCSLHDDLVVAWQGDRGVFTNTAVVLTADPDWDDAAGARGGRRPRRPAGTAGDRGDDPGLVRPGVAVRRPAAA